MEPKNIIITLSAVVLTNLAQGAITHQDFDEMAAKVDQKRAENKAALALANMPEDCSCKWVLVMAKDPKDHRYVKSVVCNNEVDPARQDKIDLYECPKDGTEPTIVLPGPVEEPKGEVLGEKVGP